MVAGMHKSGTTLVAKLLHEAGIPMVEDPASTGDYDAGHHFERASTLRLNHALLEGAMSRLPRPVVTAAGVQVHHSLSILRREPRPNADTLQMMEELVGSQENQPWGFKDPRTALTYSVWSRVLPEHRLVVVFRDSCEVADRYARSKAGLMGRLVRSRAQRVWRQYNEKLVEHVRAAGASALVLRFEDLVTDGGEELGRLERFLGTNIPTAPDPTRYRHRRPRSGGGPSASFLGLGRARHGILSELTRLRDP